MSIHGLAYLHDTKQLKESENILNQLGGKFWSRVAYKIGQHVFSLDDIEHGILRGRFLEC